MLYSVAICDLLFKLQELADMYNDTVAVEILQEVEKCRNPGDNKSKSRWEKEFVDSIYTKTELLDLESYTNLNHLYDHRNFSAHPALNDRYELVSPSKETTIALIKSILENILIKPPIFVKRVTDMLLEDLSEKKSIYQDEPEKLREYLRRKYFDRMSDSMKKAHSVLSGNCAFAYQMMKTVSAIDQLIEKRWSFCSVIHPGCLNS